jgi:hypothetical protein
MQTTVVNCKKSRGEHYDIYIGRQARGGYKQSKWANPYTIGPDGTRDQVIAKYEAYLQTRPDLLAALPELRGKVLGCWCKPLACHGDVLARLADEAAA